MPTSSVGSPKRAILSWHMVAIQAAARRLWPSIFSDSRAILSSNSGRSCKRKSPQYLGELRAQVRNFRARLVLGLNEVTLVDVAVVRFLMCEAEGSIREWMDREQDTTRGRTI